MAMFNYAYFFCIILMRLEHYDFGYIQIIPVVIIPNQGSHSTGKTGKTGKLVKSNSSQGKHRELDNFGITQGI